MLSCADVPLRNYSLTHSLREQQAAEFSEDNDSFVGCLAPTFVLSARTTSHADKHLRCHGNGGGGVASLISAVSATPPSFRLRRRLAVRFRLNYTATDLGQGKAWHDTSSTNPGHLSPPRTTVPQENAWPDNCSPSLYNVVD